MRQNGNGSLLRLVLIVSSGIGIGTYAKSCRNLGPEQLQNPVVLELTTESSHAFVSSDDGALSWLDVEISPSGALSVAQKYKGMGLAIDLSRVVVEFYDDRGELMPEYTQTLFGEKCSFFTLFPGQKKTFSVNIPRAGVQTRAFVRLTSLK